MNDEWPEGRIEFTTINAGNLRRLHVDVVQAIQAVDRETCTAVVIPGRDREEAARILRMIVDGEVNDAADERARIVAWLRGMPKKLFMPTVIAEFIARGAHLEEK